MKKFVLGLALAMTLAAFVPVASAGDNRVERRGSCSGASDWKLKAKPDNGRLEVEYEVDENVNGHTWRVTLKRNGNRFFRGLRTTQPPSGSFEVRKHTNNGPGEDRINARARNLKTDELCRGHLTI
jgi:hypothetical protein